MNLLRQRLKTFQVREFSIDKSFGEQRFLYDLAEIFPTTHHNPSRSSNSFELHTSASNRRTEFPMVECAGLSLRGEIEQTVYERAFERSN